MILSLLKLFFDSSCLTLLTFCIVNMRTTIPSGNNSNLISETPSRQEFTPDIEPLLIELGYIVRGVEVNCLSLSRIIKTFYFYDLFLLNMD